MCLAVTLWQRLANIDLRSLALFRIGLALSVLACITSYFHDFSLIFPDDGIFPRRYSMGYYNTGFSLFFLSGEQFYTGCILALGISAALLLMVGYYSRLACITCWIIIASLNSRLQEFLYFADTQLLVLLFWGMFLPLGARFSVDHALSRPRIASNNYASMATLAVLLQESYLYFFGALFKTSDNWHINHTAIEYAFGMIDVKKTISDYLLQWPEFLKFLTMYVYYLEITAIIFLFLPIFTSWFRLIMFILLACLHLGFAIFLNVGFFPLISISGLCVFIPAMVWNHISLKINYIFASQQHTIYYDKLCDFCCKICLIFRELSLLQSTPVEAAQDTPAIYALMQKENSWVVKTDTGKLLTKWEAIAYLWRHSPILFIAGIIFSLPFLKKPGNALYEIITTNRGNIAKLLALFLPYRTSQIIPSRLAAIALVPLIICVAMENIYMTLGPGYAKMPSLAQNIIADTHLFQEWKMFAEPPTNCRWSTVEGITTAGTKIDLLFNKKWVENYSMPPDSATAYPNDRINCYLNHGDFDDITTLYGPGLCAIRNKTSNPQLKTITLAQYQRKTLLEQPAESWPVNKIIIFTYQCDKQIWEEVDKTPQPITRSNILPALP